MTARTHSLRFLALCGGLLLLLLVLSWDAEAARQALQEALGITPLVFGATFLVNRVLVTGSDRARRKQDLEAIPTDAETRVTTVISLLTLVLGLSCAAVAALAPPYLPAIAWVAPVLAGVAGIHLAAII